MDFLPLPNEPYGDGPPIVVPPRMPCGNPDVDCPGDRIIALPATPVVTTSDALIIDSALDGTRQTSLESILNLFLQATGGITPRVIAGTLNLQPDVDGEYAVVDHHLNDNRLIVALWRLRGGIWEVVLGQLNEMTNDRLVVRFSRTIGSYPVRYVITAPPAPPAP